MKNNSTFMERWIVVECVLLIILVFIFLIATIGGLALLPWGVDISNDVMIPLLKWLFRFATLTPFAAAIIALRKWGK